MLRMRGVVAGYGGGDVLQGVDVDVPSPLQQGRRGRLELSEPPAVRPHYAPVRDPIRLAVPLEETGLRRRGSRVHHRAADEDARSPRTAGPVSHEFQLNLPFLTSELRDEPPTRPVTIAP